MTTWTDAENGGSVFSDAETGGSDVTATGESLITASNAAAALSALGVSAFAQTVLDDTTAADARTTLGAAGTAALAADSGSSLVGFLPSGNGASTRTMQAKARDIVSLADFGPAGDGSTDDTTAVSNALNSGAKEVLVTPGTFKISDVDLPAGVTLRGAGGKIKFTLGSTASGIDCASESKIVDVVFDVGGSDSLGTSAAIDIEGTDVQIVGCHFEGETGAGSSNNKVNYTIRFSNTADCSRALIAHNTFKNTFFGIIRQLGTTGLASHSRIIGNTFSGVDKGDAIEINIGKDVGFVILGNTIDDVSADGVSNAGIAIGIAGDATSGNGEDDEARRFIIANNYVNNSIMGIHVEGCNNFLIQGNAVSNVTGGTGSEGGIQCWGCSEFTIQGNHTFGNDIAGIKVAAESTDDSFSVAISGNTCVDDPRGIHVVSDETGETVSITGNTIINASVGGIVGTGTADWAISGNVTQGCGTAYILNMSSASNRLHFAGNIDHGSTTKFSLSNASSTSFNSQGNCDVQGDMDAEIVIAADATSFDARNGRNFRTSANTGATAITAITGRAGQTINIRGGSNTNSTTIADSGNFRLSAALTLGANMSITLFCLDGSTWLERCRSAN